MDVIAALYRLAGYPEVKNLPEVSPYADVETYDPTYPLAIWHHVRELQVAGLMASSIPMIMQLPAPSSLSSTVLPVAHKSCGTAHGNITITQLKILPPSENLSGKKLPGTP